MSITVKVERSKQTLSDRFLWSRRARVWALEMESLCVEAIKKEAPVYKTDRTDRWAAKPGHLRDSIGAKSEVTKENVAIEFFTQASYAKYVIGGAQPHTYGPKNASILYWKEGGVEHFRREVNHPGVKNKNDFVTRALLPLVPVIKAKFRETMITGLGE